MPAVKARGDTSSAASVEPAGSAVDDPLGRDALGADPLTQPATGPAATGVGTPIFAFPPPATVAPAAPAVAPADEEPSEGGLGATMKRGAQRVGHAIASGAEAAWTGTKAAGHAVARGASSAGHAIADGAVAAGHAIADGASAAGHAIADGASAAGHAIASGAEAAWEGTKAAGRATASAAKAGWKATEDFRDAAKSGATHGALIGGGLAGATGLAAGGLVGGAAGGLTASTGRAKKGALGLGGLVAAPLALGGAAVGAIGGLVTRGVDAFRGDEKGLLEKTASIPAHHVILEQLAHHYAYGRGDPATLALWDYKIAKEHEDSNSGFRVVAFAPVSDSSVGPDGKPLKPVVAFRGTANGGGVQDDANAQGVGTFQFSRNEKEIELVIAAATGSSKPDVTGHSLGGALAQLAAARFGSMIADVVTFQSPGINAAEVMRIDAEKHKSTHYRAKGDLVSDAGEAHSPGEVFTFEHKGPNSPLTHLTFPLAELNALRQKHDMDTPIVTGTRSDADKWVPASADAPAHHKGSWDKDEAKVKSGLLAVRHHEDVADGPTSLITDVLSLGEGRGVSEPARAAIGGASGISDRQSGYAAAWREIRAVCRTVTKPEQIPTVRAQVVELCLKHGVDPKDHGKFISQAEAAMLTALEASPLHVGPPAT